MTSQYVYYEEGPAVHTQSREEAKLANISKVLFKKKLFSLSTKCDFVPPPHKNVETPDFVFY